MGRALLLPVALVLAVALIACSGGSASAPSPAAAATSPVPSIGTSTLPADVVAQIDRAAGASLRDGVTGAIVSVVDPARGTLIKAYGTADTAGTPMTPDLHYRIASVSKTFTADAVLELAGQGRLDLDAPLSDFVPDVPNASTIRIRDLLAMRGGVFDFTADPGFLARYTADPTLPGWTPQDVVGIVRANAAQAKPPNTATVYSNSEFVLLGLVLERVTGQSAQQYLTGLIGRFGLSQTSYPTTDALPSPSSRGYIATGDPQTPPPYRDGTTSNPQVPFTAGALISTVPDLTRYAPMLAGGQGLSPSVAAQRQTWGPLTTSGPRAQYGLGILQLGDWVGHNGSIFGYSDAMFHLPSQRATVVFMVNAGDGEAVPAQALWGEVARLLYPQSIPTW
ncbi:serine hydrolase domain-containing protein [Actinomycetospora straminea]|uniref:Serine hydrolase domain-containing protein n=1 Tax=Actinomycetospora straminea TaxID=663607 RepID=A0ABP9E6P9_9PSEU|nr:serine hydrolase domain-containing protein [Actinomycetospora straminea]MDD7934594.1 serine hydrolase [Actinomycetospora straminea]